MGNLGFQELLFIIIVIGVFIVPLVFFLITLQNTMKVIEPENRRMKPEHVWLILIPLVGSLYAFLVVIAIANSCKLQLEKYGVFSLQKTTFGLGLAWAICLLSSLFWKALFIPSMLLLFIYWFKVNEIRKQMLQLKEVFTNKESNSIL